MISFCFLLAFLFGLVSLPSVSCAEIDVFTNTTGLVPVFSWAGLFLASTSDFLRVPAVLASWCTLYQFIASAIKLVFNQFKSDFLAAASLLTRLDKLRQHLQQGTFPVGVRKAFKSRSRRVSLLTSIIESKEAEYQSLLTRCTTSFVLARFGQQIIDQYLSMDAFPSSEELENISEVFAHLRYLVEWYPSRAKGSSIPESDLFNLLDGSTHDSIIFKNLRTFLVCRFFSLMGQAIPSKPLQACFAEKQKKIRLGSDSLLEKASGPRLTVLSWVGTTLEPASARCLDA